MFGRRHFLDEDVDAFHMACWSWLLRGAGGMDEFRQTPLVLPTAEFFPKSDSLGHDRAVHVFETTKRLARMDDWPVDLVAQAELPRQLSQFVSLEHQGNAAGTFQMHGSGGVITFDPAHIDAPLVLVATFAHELGHYLNGGFDEPPPGGDDLVEPATDVTAAFLGFGVFGANACFEFQKNSEGWASQKLGYISEAEWAFNIAIFCALGEHDAARLKPYLKPRIYKEVQSGLKFIARNDVIPAILAAADTSQS